MLGRRPRVGFKINGAFAGYAGTELSVEVVRANRHARDWLADNEPVFDTSGVENTKLIGVTDTGFDGTTSSQKRWTLR
jgi:hypothetical protein